MTEQNDPVKENISKLTQAYDTFLDRTRTSLKEMGSEIPSALHLAMDKAKQKAVEMKELTVDEAEKIAEYVRRDIHDAAHYIVTEKRELADWLRLDLLLLKKNAHTNFEHLVNQMQSEIKHTTKNMKRSLVWHTGEITSIGTLECDNCHELIHFHDAGHIPPCPKCQKTNFHRRWQK